MPNSQNEDIDLVHLIITVAKFARKHVMLISLFIIGGILVSVGFGITKKDAIQSKMVLSSDILTTASSRQIITSLNNLIKANDVNELAQTLNLSSEEASQIYSINVEVIAEKTKEEENDKSTIIIDVEVVNDKILPLLQQRIVNYFENNPYIKLRVEGRKEWNQKLIQKIQLELNSLDSLKKLFIEGKPPRNQSGFSYTDPAKINVAIVDLYKQLLSSTNDLREASSVQLVEGFTSLEKPQRQKLSIQMMVGFFAGLILSLGFIGLRWLAKNSKPD